MSLGISTGSLSNAQVQSLIDAANTGTANNGYFDIIYGITANADIVLQPNGSGSVSVPSLKVPVGSLIQEVIPIAVIIEDLQLDSVIGTSNSDILAANTYGDNYATDPPWTVYKFTTSPSPVLQIDDVISGAGIPYLPTPSYINFIGTGIYTSYIIANTSIAGLPQPEANTNIHVVRAVELPGFSISTIANTNIVLNPGNTGNIIVTTSVIPKEDALLDLGSPRRRFRRLYLGGGTIYILDETIGVDLAIGARDGNFYIAGASGLRVGEFILKDNTISVIDLARDIQIGTLGANGHVVVNRTLELGSNIQFMDGSVQNTAVSFDTDKIAIGSYTAVTPQGDYAIAIGSGAGNLNQGPTGVAIGYNSGNDSQGVAAVAIGQDAGYQGQGNYGVAIGSAAGSSQGDNAIAIGQGAGNENQGVHAIAIGTHAGDVNQPNNSIILNATGDIFNANTSGLFIQPIRSTTSNNIIYYNSTTKEVSYNTIPTWNQDTTGNARNANSATYALTSNSATYASTSNSATYATTANSSTYALKLYDGAVNKIPFQSGVSNTSFINAPDTANTFLEWSGNNFIWTAKTTPPPAFGQIWSDMTQYANTADTIYHTKFNKIDGHNLVALGSGTSNSRCIISRLGYYNIQFSAQLDTPLNQSYLYMWLRKNGQDLPGTTGIFSNDKKQYCISGWNTLVEVTSVTDYFELMISSNVDNVMIPTVPAQTIPYARPMSPSVILTVVPVGV